VRSVGITHSFLTNALITEPYYKRLVLLSERGGLFYIFSLKVHNLQVFSKSPPVLLLGGKGERGAVRVNRENAPPHPARAFLQSRLHNTVAFLEQAFFIKD